MLLVALYLGYVAVIWVFEGEPPAIGETAELQEAKDRAASGSTSRRVGQDLVLIVAGVAAMAVGATLLVEGVRHVAHVDSSQTQISLTLIGFATALELVALAVSAQRKGNREAVVAAVVGSFAYNATMTLGASALARPLHIVDPGRLRVPLVFMVGALVAAIALSWPKQRLSAIAGVGLLACYPIYVFLALIVR